MRRQAESLIDDTIAEPRSIKIGGCNEPMLTVRVSWYKGRRSAPCSKFSEFASKFSQFWKFSKFGGNSGIVGNSGIGGSLGIVGGSMRPKARSNNDFVIQP